MTEQTPSSTVPAVHALCLDGWQPGMGVASEYMLGSLSAVLGGFAAHTVPAGVVPTQRTAPEVAARMR